jgi:uncharacterized MAPEG superfamily protein
VSRRKRSSSITTELRILAWTVVLALVQIILASTFRTIETGVAYNAGPRDEAGPPVGTTTARLRRAQANLFETLPLFAIVILVAHVGGREGSLTLWGAWIYLLGRLAYVPLYWLGVPMVRSLVWAVSVLGLLMVLKAVL